MISFVFYCYCKFTQSAEPNGCEVSVQESSLEGGKLYSMKCFTQKRYFISMEVTTRCQTPLKDIRFLIGYFCVWNKYLVLVEPRVE